MTEHKRNAEVHREGTNFVIDGETFSFYDILGICEGESFSQEDLAKKWKSQSLKYHPDRKTGDEELFKALNQAFETLQADEKRHQYEMDRQDAGERTVSVNEAAAKLFSGPLPSDTLREKMATQEEKYRQRVEALELSNDVPVFFNFETIAEHISTYRSASDDDSKLGDTAVKRGVAQSFVRQTMIPLLEKYTMHSEQEFKDLMCECGGLAGSGVESSTPDTALLDEAKACYLNQDWDGMLLSYQDVSDPNLVLKSITRCLHARYQSAPFEIHPPRSDTLRSALKLALCSVVCKCIDQKQTRALVNSLALLSVLEESAADEKLLCSIASFMFGFVELDNTAKRATASVLMSLSNFGLSKSRSGADKMQERKRKWLPIVVAASCAVSHLLSNTTGVAKLNGQIWNDEYGFKLYTEHVDSMLEHFFYHCDFTGVVALVYDTRPPPFLLSFDDFLGERLFALLERPFAFVEETSPARFQSFRLFVDALMHRCVGDLAECCVLLMASLMKCPLENISAAVSAVLEKDEVLHVSAVKTFVDKYLNNLGLRGDESSPPTAFHYQHWFRRTASSQIRMIREYEKAILREIDDPTEKALSYLDLGVACDSATAHIVSDILCLKWMVESMRSQQDPAKLFSRQEFINGKTLGLFLALRRGVLSPPCRLACMKSLVACVAECNRLCHDAVLNLSPNVWVQEVLWNDVNKNISYLSRCCPLPMLDLGTVCDSIFIDSMARRCFVSFLKLRLERQQMDETRLCGPADAAYFSFEGVWRFWGDMSCGDTSGNDESEDEEDTKMPEDQTRLRRTRAFYKARLNLMDTLLRDRDWSVGHMEEILSWRCLPRNDDGFLDVSSGTLPLQFDRSDGTLYQRMNGIEFDFQTGRIDCSFVRANTPQQAVFSQKDVDEVFQKGILAAMFSLDPPQNGKKCLNYHPCQNMRFSDRLADTDYMLTMFHADYMLKMISQGTEISSRVPFWEQDVFTHGFMRVLPRYIRNELDFEYLRQFVKDSTRRDITGQAHRFWITAGKVEYTVTQRGNKVFYKFGDPQMSVKKHLLKRCLDGSVVDDNENDDKNGIEAVFAANFTEFFGELSKSFLIFARLRELAKLSAAFQIILSQFRSQTEALTNITDNDSVSSIQAQLKSMRTRIIGDLPCWPLTNHASVLMDQTLAANNATRSQVAPAELTRVQNNINSNLLRQQNDLICKLSGSLASGGVSVSSIHSNVYGWLSGNVSQETAIALALSADAAQKRRNQIQLLLRFISDTLRVNTDLDVGSVREDACTYVPAVFSDNQLVERRRQRGIGQVYGGVALTPILTKVLGISTGIRIVDTISYGNKTIVQFVNKARRRRFSAGESLISFRDVIETVEIREDIPTLSQCNVAATAINENIGIQDDHFEAGLNLLGSVIINRNLPLFKKCMKYWDEKDIGAHVPIFAERGHGQKPKPYNDGRKSRWEHGMDLLNHLGNVYTGDKVDFFSDKFTR